MEIAYSLFELLFLFLYEVSLDPVFQEASYVFEFHRRKGSSPSNLMFDQKYRLYDVSKSNKHLTVSSGVPSYNSSHNIWRLFYVSPNLISPQVEKSLIISNDYGTYELPHKFPNELRLRTLGNQEISSQNFIDLQFSPQPFS